MKMRKIEVNQVRGFKLGNAEDKEAATGCTVIICEKGAVGGVDIRGGAPATKDTDLLKSENSVDNVNAVVLSGGSSFGLEACSGVMRFLSQNGVGYRMKDGTSIPVVCGAALYDLEVGHSDVFPDVAMGKHACENAYRGVFGNGNNGAGTGASCGKYLGMDRAMKTGLGTFACGDDYLQIGAISAVNTMGDVVGGSGGFAAGLRSKDGRKIIGTVRAMREKVHTGYSDESWDFEAVENEHLKKERSKKEKPKDEKPAKSNVKAAGFIIEKNRDVEKNDIAAAMMAAFENSKDTAGKHESPSEGNASEKSSKSASAYVEAIKAEALARAEKASKAGPDYAAAGLKDSVQAAKKHTEDPVLAAGKHAMAALDGLLNHSEPEAVKPDTEIKDKTQNPDSSPAKAPDSKPEDTYLDEYLSSDTVQESSFSRADTYSAEGSNMRSYEDIVEEEEQDDDDLGYDIPFNTVLSCVITNAKLSRSQANKLASILHDAYARALKPSHTTMDGDTIFVLATGQREVNFDSFAVLATDVLQYAIIDGALSARSAYGLPAARDISK